MYHVFDSDMGKAVLDDLSKLCTQLRIIHSFACIDPFRNWFFRDDQWDVRELIYFSVVPAGVSSAYRLLDERNSAHSLKQLMKDYERQNVSDLENINAAIEEIRKSDSYNRLLLHRHQFIAHRGTHSSAQRKLAASGKSTEWQLEDAAETLWKIATIVRDALIAGSAIKKLPTGFEWSDSRAIKTILRLYGESSTSPLQRWNELTDQRKYVGVFNLNFDKSAPKND